MYQSCSLVKIHWSASNVFLSENSRGEIVRKKQMVIKKCGYAFVKYRLWITHIWLVCLKPVKQKIIHFLFIIISKILKCGSVIFFSLISLGEIVR